jgi:3-hydroxymyristoyl/3-hydroxydecanoyl-(acyl carrier protein) dehydratase
MKLMFSKQHPSIEGHFPGNPVVPAVAILSELMAWAESETGRRVIGVKSARFRSALHPEVCWTAEMEKRSGGTLGITCRDQGRVTMSAKLFLERA